MKKLCNGLKNLAPDNLTETNLCCNKQASYVKSNQKRCTLFVCLFVLIQTASRGKTEVCIDTKNLSLEARSFTVVCSKRL